MLETLGLITLVAGSVLGYLSIGALVAAYGRSIKDPENAFRDACYEVPFGVMLVWPVAIFFSACFMLVDRINPSQYLDLVLSALSRRLFK